MNNMFDGYKTSLLFVELSEMFEGKKKEKFSQEVRDLYWKKILSPDGEYKEYVITRRDLDTISSSLSRSVHHVVAGKR